MPDATYAIKWDEAGKRFYETGVKMGVFYPRGTNEDGEQFYNHGVAWNGLTAVTEKPTGADVEALYADDMKYLELRGREDFEATVEAYTYPDEFALCDGSAVLATGVIIGQQKRKPFGMCYRTVIGNDTEYDTHGYKLHLVYGCSVSPSERAYSTINDSPEAITFSWDMTTVPENVTGHDNVACITIDSTKADATCLAALEQILYGTPASTGVDAVDPRMPLPDEVKSVMTPTPTPPGP